MSKANTQTAPRCSFCGRSNALVGHLIAGPDGANICDECVGTCQQLLARAEGEEEALPKVRAPAKRKSVNANTNEEAPRKTSDGMAVVENKPTPPQPIKLVPPAEIRAVLDAHVIGQDQAKKTLSVAVYNHYKRLNSMLDNESAQSGLVAEFASVEVEKSNILLLGPTGSGKTLLARTLAQVLDVPFAIADATTVTEAGYVGEDVESIVQRLLLASDFDTKRAETGIIYIDEIDKLALKGDSPHTSRNLGQGVQYALLKIIEGCQCNVPPQGGRKHPEQQYVSVNTSNILFICGGAFVGLDEIIGRRIGTKFLGFELASKPGGEPLGAEQIMANLQPEDLFNFGLIPEFVGRLPVVSALSELRQKDLERVLLEPKNALTKQYQKLFAMEGVKLTFTPDGISAIAKKAIEMKTGARGLRSIIERMMLNTMYQLPQRPGTHEVIISEAMLLEGREPEMLGKN